MIIIIIITTICWPLPNLSWFKCLNFSILQRLDMKATAAWTWSPSPIQISTINIAKRFSSMHAMYRGKWNDFPFVYSLYPDWVLASKRSVDSFSSTNPWSMLHGYYTEIESTSDWRPKIATTEEMKNK